ncbi:hypothetical protein BBG47_00485 [Paenibacillus sp. KS1]|uniref:alpha/beta fold hydrolase n=1 Tax=Paenibacillus sp. KS1 TaxID=1849249 RepID=UPI0008065000|nr:alpha/beta fold hydrolase [Paenibacillus sp. KS1]OBY81590.1 hypothetical protein BBG47_00485 [Paenibacillus sp. KS1]
MDKIVKKDSVEVLYSVEGSGSGLLLIHGTGATHQLWEELSHTLSSHFTVMSPNYGQLGTNSRLELDDVVEQHLAVASQEGFEQFHVIGYSLGAEIAAALAAKYPMRIQSLTLVAGWVESDVSVHFQFDLWHKLLNSDRTAFAQFLMHTGYSSDYLHRYTIHELLAMADDLAQNLAPEMNHHIELDTRINLRPLLGSITAPTLVIGLTHDRMVPVEQTKELAALISGSQYREIASGHLIVTENGVALLEELLLFLAQVDGRLRSVLDGIVH